MARGYEAVLGIGEWLRLDDLETGEHRLGR